MSPKQGTLRDDAKCAGSVESSSSQKIAQQQQQQQQHQRGKMPQEVQHGVRDEALQFVVFGGGGARGWAHMGALRAVKAALGIDWGERRPPLRAASGTSIGAMMAFSIVLGYSVEERDVLFSNVDETKLLPIKLEGFFSSGAIGDGREMLEHLRFMLIQKLHVRDITLAALQARTGMALCVVTYDLAQARAVYLSPHTTPAMSAVEAVYASLAVPLLLPPARVDLTSAARVSVADAAEPFAKGSYKSSCQPAVSRIDSTATGTLTASAKATASASATAAAATAAAETGDARQQHIDGAMTCASAATAATPQAQVQREAASGGVATALRDVRRMVMEGVDAALMERNDTPCIDGGIADNLPMRVFPPGDAIGFRLDWNLEEVAASELLASTLSMLMRVCSTALYEAACLEWKALDAEFKNHVISLRTGATPLLHATPEDAQAAKAALIKQGYDATLAALADNPTLCARLQVFKAATHPVK
jgi:predicted acylesterase/phospholipase RssA